MVPSGQTFASSGQDHEHSRISHTHRRTCRRRRGCWECRWAASGRNRPDRIRRGTPRTRRSAARAPRHCRRRTAVLPPCTRCRRTSAPTKRTCLARYVHTRDPRCLHWGTPPWGRRAWARIPRAGTPGRVRDTARTRNRGLVARRCCHPDRSSRRQDTRRPPRRRLRPDIPASRTTEVRARRRCHPDTSAPGLHTSRCPCLRLSNRPRTCRSRKRRGPGENLEKAQV